MVRQLTRGQRRFVVACAVIALAGFCIWLYFEPSFEPLIGIFISLSSLAAVSWPNLFGSRYARKRLTGRVTFDYSQNDGLYAIGSGDLLFETQWTKASDTSIHTYKDRPSIVGIALAPNARSIADVTDAGAYEMSSRTVTPQEVR